VPEQEWCKERGWKIVVWTPRPLPCAAPGGRDAALKAALGRLRGELEA
jgi:hypothetical protein